MSDLVLSLLPEVKEIKDESLQKKVIGCWVEAIAFRDGPRSCYGISLLLSWLRT